MGKRAPGSKRQRVEAEVGRPRAGVEVAALSPAVLVPFPALEDVEGGEPLLVHGPEEWAEGGLVQQAAPAAVS